jgi:hypothetical protein
MNIYNLDPEIIVVEDILSAEELKSLQECANDPDGWDVYNSDIAGTHWEGNQKFLTQDKDQKNIEIIGKVIRSIDSIVGHKGLLTNVSIIQRFTDVKKGDTNITFDSGQPAYFDNQGVEWSMGPHADKVYDMVTKSFVKIFVLVKRRKHKIGKLKFIMEKLRFIRRKFNFFHIFAPWQHQ